MLIKMGILILIIAAALLMLFRLGDSIEEENRMLETGLESVRMYNEALERRTEKIRRLRHDTLGLLQAIENVGERTGQEGENKEIAGALSSFDMPLLDAIVEMKTKQCQDNDISFEISCENAQAIAGDDMPDETDLCLLIQNLLENAYEANLRINDKDRRRMSLAIETTGGISIKASNSLAENEKPSFITRKVNSELHGIGMKVIDEIVTKYYGSKEVWTDSDRGEVSICIYLNKHKA